MDLKIWLKFVYFDSLVVDASSSAPEEKSSQQIWWKSKSSFEAQYFLLATEFWVSIDIKSDHDKPNYNPYLHKFFCSKDKSFHTIYLYGIIYCIRKPSDNYLYRNFWSVSSEQKKMTLIYFKDFPMHFMTNHKL